MALKTRTSLGGRTKKFSHKRVSTALDQLSVAELVSVLQENEYLFKHVLVQDTAYQSLLRNDRRRLHGAIGQTLEKTYGRRANEFAAELAHHFFEAGDDEKKLFYTALAGDDAARVFAHPEATGFYELACDILEQRLDSVEGRRQFVDLTVKLVAVSLRTHGPAKSIERLSQAEDLLRDLQTEMQDRERLARVLF
jgi:predicted ATPase